MKTLFTILSALILLSACAQQPRQNAEEATQEIYPPDMHTARIALDYEGTYHGILPCANCEGIETEITLKDSVQFIKITRYLGKSDEVFEQSGRYSWNEQGNTITLKGVEKPNRYFVAENALIHLTIDDMPITGELADKYRLRKTE